MVRNLLSGTPQIANIPSRMRLSFTCEEQGIGKKEAACFLLILHNSQSSLSHGLLIPLHKDFSL